MDHIPPLLAVIIPAYNEERTLRQLVERVLAVDIPKEIVIVNDGSTDDTDSIAYLMASMHPNIRRLTLHQNHGKGYAVRMALLSGFKADIVLIQDADLELDPEDYYDICRPFVDPTVSVVYGSRFLGHGYWSTAQGPFWSRMANMLLAAAVNILWPGTGLTDEATSYKAFRWRALAMLPLTCTGFEFCPEVTGMALNRGYTIHEVPIAYHPRTRSDGKKVRLRDAFVAFATLLRVKFHDNR
jgi:glycosyltransferase involved in cell wall biosynthesis